jgi:glycosyltransferase involved in cell wall biosynthesis
VKADLYIGRYLPALPAVAQAARIHRAKFGFDAEDSHVDELLDTPEHQNWRQAREEMERAYLPECSHLTAAAPLIADVYADRYGVRPLSILNVFPSREAPSHPERTSHQKGEGRPKLYWFSQTIGRGRGLEQILTAMARMDIPVELHLRGIPSRGYQELIEAHARQLGLQDRLVIHPPAPPAEMLRLASPYDIGLGLELCEPPHRALCLPNKIFSYLLAGVPVLLSRTPAQERLAGELSEAALLADLNDATGTAARLDAFLADAVRQQCARETAWRLGQERYNWDVEKHAFLDSVRRALDKSDL